MHSAAIDSARPSVSADDACARDERVMLLAQLRASQFDISEHPDRWTLGWNAAKQHAIDLLFPLPKPIYSCTFPMCAPAVDMRGTVEIDFSQLEDV